MRLIFASDIHGSEYYTKKLLERYEDLKCDKLILLGDILYHGPRNDLPEGYNPKGVIALLNALSDEILCVRGNCEAEVDQMVLDFSCMSESMVMFERGKMLFITHGHKFNMENLPKLKKGDILIHGHTHVQTVESFGENLYINPGSISIPKENNPPSFMLYENGRFTIYDFDMNVLNEVSI
ncbi:MAG: phosphodiesterase [Clostridia bacterium]|nr:phosphodiesterase [Clostridia bacterium]